MVPHPTMFVASEAERQPPGSERRTSTRYASGLDATLQPVMARDGSPWVGQVLNISRCGLGILLNRRFEPRTLLVVELENAEPHASRTVLARVVHITPHEAGWLLGCALTAELDDDDLDVFRARRERPRGTECRAWVRFSCDLATSCAPAGSDEAWPARIVNVAPCGLGLVVPGQVGQGTVLVLDVPGARSGQSRRVLVRVVQAAAQEEGGWLLGCEFTEQLSDEDLQGLCAG
jgi:hypothetical protein